MRNVVATGADPDYTAVLDNYCWSNTNNAQRLGELVRAIRRGERNNLEEEFADVYAWLATLASLHGLDLDQIGAKKYAAGCPRCRAVPCACPHPKPVG
jgi:hypothetical protein